MLLSETKEMAAVEDAFGDLLAALDGLPWASLADKGKVGRMWNDAAHATRSELAQAAGA